MGFIGTWLVTAIATAIAIWLVPGISAVGGSVAGPVFAALFLALVNAVIRPVMRVLSLPLTILTLGVFSLVINAMMLELASYLSRQVFGAGISIDGFGSAFAGAIVISLCTMVLGAVIR